MNPIGNNNKVEKTIFNLNMDFVTKQFLTPQQRAVNPLLRQQLFYTFYNLAVNIWSHFSYLLQTVNKLNMHHHPQYKTVPTHTKYILLLKTRTCLHAKGNLPVWN